MDLHIGTPQVRPDTPSHVRGVPEGNLRKRRDEPGLKRIGRMVSASARRSTGVNAEGRRPIDPRMPVLTPA